MLLRWFPHALVLAAGCLGIATAGAESAAFQARLAEGLLEDYLPPHGDGWTRTALETGPADPAVFGAGTSTRARYGRDGATCTVTLTGGSANMQGVSMTFSNPAVAGFTGNQMIRVGSERVLVTPAGEHQAFANNVLVQVTGDCSPVAKQDLIARTDVEGLRALGTEYGGPGPDAAAAKAPVDGGPPPLVVTGPLPVAWERTFGGTASDWSYAMTGTRDGGLAAAGRTESKGAGREDLWVVRLTGAGEPLWDRALGGPATDRARAVIETRDGGFVLAGATESKGSGEFDVWVVKLDRDGNPLWDRTFGGPATDWASAIVETRDGGLAVAAYTQDAAEAPYDIWVLKLDGKGRLRWQRRLGGPATEWASAIAEDARGNILVAGHTESKGAGDADMWVLKFSPRGRLRWDRTFGGAKRDYAAAIAATRDGGMVVAGPVDSNPAEQLGAGGVDARLLKLTAAGQVVWDRTIGGGKDDWPRAVVELPAGGYAVSGYTDSRGAGQYDQWLFRLDAAGTLRWEQTLGGPANEWARSLVLMPDGGFALSGDNWSKGAGMADIWVVRLKPEP